MRNGIVGVHDVEAEVARDLDDLVGEREQILRLAEQRVRRRHDLVEREAVLVFTEPEGHLRADHVHLVTAAREDLAELRGDNAAPANRRVADDPDVHPVPPSSRCAATTRCRTTTPSACATPTCAPKWASRLSISC